MTSNILPHLPQLLYIEKSVAALKSFLMKCIYLKATCWFCVVWTDYPWRVAAQPLTSNVIKWFYLPDFAKRPNPIFIFCEFFFTLTQRREDKPTLCPRPRF